MASLPPSIAEHSPFRSILFLLFCLPTLPYHLSIYFFFWIFCCGGSCAALPLSWRTSVLRLFLLSRNAKIDMLTVGWALFSMKRVNYAIAVQTMAI